MKYSMYLSVLILVFSFQKSFSDIVINNKTFPTDFWFGAATSAFQVEGAWDKDGKSQSIWDYNIHRNPRMVEGQTNGDISSDSYYLYETDLALLKELGVSHYKFSISWPRILPSGFADDINPAGVAYYKKFIALLKENNIIPLVTMFHWDLPQSLEEQGGFQNESVIDWFSDYARVCFDSFGSDVQYWITFSEGVHICDYEYRFDSEEDLSGTLDYICAHNLIRAHATAWHIYDEEFREQQKGQVSIAHATHWYKAYFDTAEDTEAAERLIQFELGWWANPLYYGDYPDVMKSRVANRSSLEGYSQSRLPEFTEEEKVFIRGTCDFFSFSTFDSYFAVNDEPPIVVPPLRRNDVGAAALLNTESTGAWGILPLLKWIQNQYNDPDIIVTGHGLEIITGEDLTADDNRILTIQSYLSGIRDAIEEGVKVFGYTHWSFIDTFEWLKGYSVNYGFYRVNFTAQSRWRTPRKSAEFFKNVTSTLCLVDECTNH